MCIDTYGHYASKKYAEAPRYRSSVGLLLTCRQTRHETLVFFHTLCRLDISRNNLARTACVLPPAIRGHIRNVTVDELWLHNASYCGGKRRLPEIATEFMRAFPTLRSVLVDHYWLGKGVYREDRKRNVRLAFASAGLKVRFKD